MAASDDNTAQAEKDDDTDKYDMESIWERMRKNDLLQIIFL